MPVPPAVRLSRAALYALGVGTLSAAACGGGQASGARGNASPDGSAPSPDGSVGGSQGDVTVFMGAPPYGIAPIQTCDSSADCVSGDTCGPLAGEPSVMVCNSCTSSAGCLPGQVCCSEGSLTTTSCQAGPCPDVGDGMQLCATSAECLTKGDVCTSVASVGLGSMGFGGSNEVDGGPSTRVCAHPSADGGTESGGVDGGDESGRADGGTESDGEPD
jgi:hypothetical protein